jgi:8-oxo-dGTP pyrophosphatase MutT (NUDIX family)
MKAQPKAIVSAILFKKEKKEIKIFLQTRWKPKSSPTYSGMLEIPAGGIDSYENVYDALKREIKEETNLDIVKIINDYNGGILSPRKNDKAFVFKPFICQQVLETNNGLPWIGFVFVCEVGGDVKINITEAKDPKWVSIKELKKIVNGRPESIFPLQLPVLKYFVENLNSIIEKI